MQMKKIVSLLLFISLLSFVFAQNGMHLSVLPSTMNSQIYQPQFLRMMDDSIRLQIGIDAGGFGGNNGFALGTLLKEGNYISNVAKEKMLSQLPANPRMQLGGGATLLVNARIGKKKKVQGFYAGLRQGTSIGASNKETLGLAFRGNSHYLGQTITDKEVFVNQLSWAELGWGISGQKGNFSWGTRVKLLAGLKCTTASVKDLSFYTAEDGGEIKVKGAYSIFQSPKNGLNGLGAGLDLGGSYRINNKMQIHASVLDLGLLSFSGNKYEKTLDLDWKGITLDNILNIDTTKNKNLLDSLKKVVFPDTIKATKMVSLPTTFHLTAEYSFNRYNKVFAGLHASANRQAPRYAIPMFNLGYQHAFRKYLILGVNGYAGGTDSYGAGFFAQFSAKIKHHYPFSLYYEMNNVTGAIGFGRGLSANTGLSFGF